MSLKYLDFDYSEDTDGIGTFEAMVSTGPEQVPAVQDEIARVLDWAHATFAGTRGPVGEGGRLGLRAAGPAGVHGPAAHRARRRRAPVLCAHGAGRPRHTVTLSISGTGGFCAAFRQQFGLDEPA
ncbi:MAG: hypothetical protein ACREXV_14520 [Polaromonas sp.]